MRFFFRTHLFSLKIYSDTFFLKLHLKILFKESIFYSLLNEIYFYEHLSFRLDKYADFKRKKMCLRFKHYKFYIFNNC